jgi:hypothetical protein
VNPTLLPIYLSRVVAVPASAAGVAFDRCWHKLATPVGDGVSQSLIDWGVSSRIVDLPAAQLWLYRDSSAVVPADGHFAPYRRVHGRLRLRRWWRAVPVELELVPWSSACSSLGLRYAGRRRLASATCECYHQAGSDALDLLGAALLGRLQVLPTPPGSPKTASDDTAAA